MRLISPHRLQQGRARPKNVLHHILLQLWHRLRRQDRPLKQMTQRGLKVLKVNVVPIIIFIYLFIKDSYATLAV